MGSPGIDEWIAKAPESWAKLAKASKKTISYEQFKKKFFEGAELENKAYLKEYLKDDQLKHIYTQGFGGRQETDHVIQPKKPVTLIVTRNGKDYTRQSTPRWGIQSKFVLKLAAEAKPRSAEYKKYLNILINQGRSKQAAVKKIQRTRKELSK